MSHTASDIHHAAANGYTAAADQYVLGRPDYPPEITQWLHEQIGLDTGKTVLELGAGTGKFTPRLLHTGAHVIAVEPVDAMREKLISSLPEVTTLTGRAQAIPLPDASVDAVICAQSFHWFASAESLREIHRVLKSGGKLGLVWNVRDSSVRWVSRLTQIMNQAEGDTPRYHNGQWRTVFPYTGFGPLHEQHFAHSQTGTVEDVLINRVLSVSFIAALAPAERAKIEAQVKALIVEEPELNGRDIVTMPHETVTYFTIKTD